MKTQTKKTAERRANLEKLFDLAYGEFATDAEEARADLFPFLDDKKSKTAIRSLFSELEKSGLMVASDVNGGIVWQCWNTYDDTDEQEHDAEFAEWAKGAGYPEPKPEQPEPGSEKDSHVKAALDALFGAQARAAETLRRAGVAAEQASEAAAEARAAEVQANDAMAKINAAISHLQVYRAI